MALFPVQNNYFWSFLQVLIACLFVVPVLSETDTSLVCPSGDFVNGTQMKITCHLLKASYPSKCDPLTVNILDFRRRPAGGAEKAFCTVNGFVSVCSSSISVGTEDCGCVSEDSIAWMFEYRFIVNDTYAGTWDCFAACFDGPNYALSYNETDCSDKNVIKVTTATTTVTTTTKAKPTPPDPDCCEIRYLLLLLLVLFLPLPIPLPWPGYPIYVALCRIPNHGSSTGSSQPDNWHPHYICGLRTNNVYFSAYVVTNDGCTVLIWSRSPTTGRFVWYGTQTLPVTNSSGAGREMGAPPSHSNNVSPESGAAKNGSKHTSQKEKNKHTGTDGSPRKSRQPEAPVELTTVRTSSPPQAATVPGDNQASGTPHGDHQASGTPRLRPLPESSRMTSVERDSTAETFTMVGRDKHTKLPPIGKPGNHP